MTTSKNTATEWKALALRATKGPWIPRGSSVGGDPDSDGWSAVALCPCPTSPPKAARRKQWEADAAFIAASSPERVIELLEEVERLTRERDEARAESALAIDMHRELASWADHRHSLSDEGHLAIQKRARDAEAQVERLRGALTDLLEASSEMPTTTPAPGGAGTLHTYHLTAADVWALDRAVQAARAALSESQNP